VFSPLWSVAIAQAGFAWAAAMLGAVMLVVLLPLCATVLRWQPLRHEPEVSPARPAARPAAGITWSNRAFLSLTMAVTFGLVAQLGLLTHLYALLVPRLGAAGAGWAMAAATVCAILGRSLASWRLRSYPDRRLLAAQFYALQFMGGLWIAAFLDAGVIVCVGVFLFGLGIGNALSLPPLIAQAEFPIDAVPRIVARFVAVSQAGYAFAPAVFAWLLQTGGVWAFVGAAGALQLGAVLFLRSGAKHRPA
jgi:fucose permease